MREEEDIHRKGLRGEREGEEARNMRNWENLLNYFWACSFANLQECHYATRNFPRTLPVVTWTNNERDKFVNLKRKLKRIK